MRNLSSFLLLLASVCLTTNAHGMEENHLHQRQIQLNKTLDKFVQKLEVFDQFRWEHTNLLPKEVALWNRLYEQFICWATVEYVLIKECCKTDAQNIVQTKYAHVQRKLLFIDSYVSNSKNHLY